MELIINKPYVKDNKLISKIEYDNNKYDLFFQVDAEYTKYLCCENADAFLVALIPFIVKHNYNVVVKGKISSKLYYQLTTYLLPMLCNAFKKEKITVDCELSNEEFHPEGVGASVSCGVDSFYTLLKHKNLSDSKRNITHVCFFNAGSNGEYGGENAKKLYDERLGHIRDFCKEQNYPLVTVDSNMNELIMMNHEKRHTFTTLACVYALEKLFNTYYFASGLGFDGSHIDEADTAFYDILNVQCLSNENITFYCSGLETSRMEKVKFIAEYKETYNWLNVCTAPQWKNDSKCTKCIRTMTALESIGKLQYYKNVFDLDYYFKHRSNFLASLLKGKRNRIQKCFCKEILNSYKENNIRIPLSAHILSLKINKASIKNFIKVILPNDWVRKMKKSKDGWMD